MLLAQHSTPGTTITTTTETLAANVPATPFTPSPGNTAIVIRGVVVVTTGTGVTAVAVRLRAGNNNTTTAQVASTETEVTAASSVQTCAFEFVDNSAPVGSTLNGTGYSITVSQTGATGNGTVTSIDFDVDRVPA